MDPHRFSAAHFDAAARVQEFASEWIFRLGTGITWNEHNRESRADFPAFPHFLSSHAFDR